MIKSWNEIIKPFMDSPEGQNIKEFIIQKRKETTVYPEQENVFRAFKENLYPYKNVKMVIVGDEPYCNGSADGFSFSSTADEQPLALTNIFKELKSNLYSYMTKEQWVEFMPTDNLEGWAKQGILLMNTVLTVEKDKPGSHRNKGWESFTNLIIEKLGEEERPIVFILWGKATKLRPLIKGKNHLVIIAVEPENAKFKGCNHFTLAHEFYRSNDYYKDSLVKFEIDLRQMFNAEAILEQIKTTIGTNNVPFATAKERIEEVKRILYADYLWNIEYMFNFTTKI